jgi:hypothetical protein
MQNTSNSPRVKVSVTAIATILLLMGAALSLLHVGTTISINASIQHHINMPDGTLTAG